MVTCFHPEHAELICQIRLKEGIELVEFGGGERSRVERSNPAIIGYDHVEEGIVDMGVRIAGNGAFGEVGRTVRAVLHG